LSLIGFILRRRNKKVTREEFSNLKPGDRIMGRSKMHGDGRVIMQGSNLYIQWENTNVLSFPLGQLSGLWPYWSASPMAHWVKLTD